MSDDDPCIEVRLTAGDETRRFSIRQIADKAAWVYSHTEAGFSIVVLESRDAAILKRAELDADVSRLIAEGWTPA